MLEVAFNVGILQYSDPFPIPVSAA